MTRGQKLLAAAAREKAAKCGDSITCAVDFCLLSDGDIHWMESYQDDAEVFEADRILAVIDHESPATTVKAAEQHSRILNFVKKTGVHFSQSGGTGYLIAQRGYLHNARIAVTCGGRFGLLGASGALAIHTAPEEMAAILISGKVPLIFPQAVLLRLEGTPCSGVSDMDIALAVLRTLAEERFEGKLLEISGDIQQSVREVLCGMLSLTGAKAITFTEVPEGEYDQIVAFDMKSVQMPLVSEEGTPFGSQSVFTQKLFSVQAVFIGGCMSGRIEDLRAAAKLLAGKRIAQGLRLFICAADQRTYIQAMDEGLISSFLDAGANILSAGCGGCHTKAYAMVGPDENLVTAGAYNDPGCCGSDRAHVYLTSVQVAATTAITGYVAAY